MNATHSTFREYWQVLRKRRNVFFSVFTGIILLVTLGSLLATPIYEGTVKIIIERVEQEDLTRDSRLRSRDPEFEETQFQLIKSHAVAKRVVRALDLEDSYESTHSPDGSSLLTGLGTKISDWASSFAKLLSGSSEEGSDADSEAEWSRVDLVAKDLAKSVRVRPIEGSHITSVQFRSPNPDFAAMAANTYIQAYLEEVLDIKLDATRRNLEWMTQKAETEQLKLQEAEKKLQEYMESHDLVTLEDRITILPESLTQLGRDLVRAESKTKEHKLLYDKVQAVSGNLSAAESVLSISEGASLDIIRAQILKAEQSVMELSSKYGSKHPVMLKAVGDLNVLKMKRRQEISRITAKVRGQYELALSNENSIRAQLGRTKVEAIELNQKYVKYSELKREIDTNRHLHDALLTKIKGQSITGETRPVNIWVVEKAKVPQKPISPILSLNLLFATIIGVGCSLLSAFFVDHMDNRIKSSDGLETILGAPVLGSVTLNSHPEAMSEIARTEPRSEFAESFNSLRTTLLLSSAEAPPKRLLITSSIAGEGKTTTSVNLALTMAKSDSRVVLIDTDLRKPSLHKIFKLHNRTGLSSYLAGRSDRSILQKSTLDNLIIIPAGPIPPNPYELLNSERMKALLQSLESDFDTIICDSPPILSVADSRLLSQDVNGLILVTRAGMTTYPMAQSSIQLLRDVNAKVLGVLVNAVLAKDQKYYEYYSSYIEDATKTQMST
jgi:capsular exopolysaccharide synthesis family protein